MIANTYVVKPFGISEVKVIALKGEPGGPTQEQVNTAVEEYMDDHPEAQIPDGAVTTEKLASNAVAPYADNLVSSSYVSDSEPYLFRKTFAGVREDTEVVGGSVVWNQLFVSQAREGTTSGVAITKVDNDTIRISGTATQNVWHQMNATTRPIVGHKYFADKGADGDYQFTNDKKGISVKEGDRYTIGNPTTNQYMYIYVRKDTTIDVTAKPMLIDLTAMFGPTIADYIYAQEQATAGAGVAFFRSLFSKPYYAYNAGTLMSVNASAHKMVGFNLFDKSTAEDGYVYGKSGVRQASVNPMRSVAMVRVFPSTSYYLKSERYENVWNVVYFDENQQGLNEAVQVPANASGTTFTTPSNCYYVGITMSTSDKDMICLNLSDPSKNGTYEPYTAHSYPLDSSLTLRGLPKLDGDNLYYDGDIYKADGTVTRLYGYRAYQSGDESLANAITDGTHTVYKLTTATTETADPFVNPQVCYPDGTEEYIDAREVPIPVGHNTKYMRDLKKLLEGIPDAPTANGTYVLKATVSSSGVTYAWIAG